MKDYCKLDEETADKMARIGDRLFTLNYCLNLFLFCLECKIHAKSAIEIYSFGSMLNEYFLNTKNMYNEIEEKLGTLN